MCVIFSFILFVWHVLLAKAIILFAFHHTSNNQLKEFGLPPLGGNGGHVIKMGLSCAKNGNPALLAHFICCLLNPIEFEANSFGNFVLISSQYSFFMVDFFCCSHSVRITRKIM